MQFFTAFGNIALNKIQFDCLTSCTFHLLSGESFQLSTRPWQGLNERTGLPVTGKVTAVVCKLKSGLERSYYSANIMSLT